MEVAHCFPRHGQMDVTQVHSIGESARNGFQKARWQLHQCVENYAHFLMFVEYRTHKKTMSTICVCVF